MASSLSRAGGKKVRPKGAGHGHGRDHKGSCCIAVRLLAEESACGRAGSCTRSAPRLDPPCRDLWEQREEEEPGWAAITWKERALRLCVKLRRSDLCEAVLKIGAKAGGMKLGQAWPGICWPHLRC